MMKKIWIILFVILFMLTGCETSEAPTDDTKTDDNSDVIVDDQTTDDQTTDDQVDDETPIYIMITFQTNGGSLVETVTIEEGDVFVLPNDPEKTGHIFDGWYTDSTFNTLFDESTNISSDTVLYAKWIPYEDTVYKVNFLNVGDRYIEPIVQLKGVSIGDTETPSKQGYLFDGWYLDETYQQLYDFSTTNTEDVTLYAKWIDDPSMAKVTFETNGGSAIEPMYVTVNSKVTIPYSTLREGHIFLKWTYDPEFTQQAFSNFVITEDVTLYAEWYENENVVYIFFDSNGGSIIYPYQKRPGQSISTPSPPPVKPGFDFIGWFEDENFTRRYYFNAMGSSDVTLYAKWQEVVGQEAVILDNVEEVLTGWDFVCVDHICELEISSGFLYVFDFNVNEFSYIKQIIEENEEGYRHYDSVITFDTDWNVEYSYLVEEDFGYYFETTMLLSGNYLNDEYIVDEFHSSIQSEESRKEAAIQTIEYFADFIESVLEATNLDLIDLQ